MSTIYQNMSASMFAFVKSFAANNNLRVWNFDAAAENEEWPNDDLIGLYQFEVTSDEGVPVITTAIGISTVGDTNLFKLTALIGALFDILQPDETIPQVDATTNTAEGTMKVQNGTRVLPVEKTKVRPFQAVAVTILGGRYSK